MEIRLSILNFNLYWTNYCWFFYTFQLFIISTQFQFEWFHQHFQKIFSTFLVSNLLKIWRITSLDSCHTIFRFLFQADMSMKVCSYHDFDWWKNWGIDDKTRFRCWLRGKSSSSSLGFYFRRSFCSLSCRRGSRGSRKQWSSPSKAFHNSADLGNSYLIRNSQFHFRDDFV